jgi:excisionase family DNA binding protein
MSVDTLPPTKSVPRLAYSVEEVKAMLGLSDFGLRLLLAEGRLAHVRVGAKVLISRASIDDFLSSPTTTPIRDPRTYRKVPLRTRKG